MPLIGLLEQFKLSNVLQRVETHEKTGLLIFKQGEKWVEFYFRDGRLMCIGPLRTHSTLAARLVQDGIISPQALQETMFVLGSADPSETRIALTLMDLNHVTHEDLRAWAAQKVLQVLSVLTTWSSGEIYFEEQKAPPPDRLLVALSITALMAQVTPITTSPLVSAQSTDQIQPMRLPAMEAVPSTPVTPMPPFQAPEPSSDQGDLGLIDASSLFSDVEGLFDRRSSQALGDPQQVVIRPSDARSAIDISYIRPDMVLIPGDFTSFQQQNHLVQLTPDQWRLLTRVDGRTSLQHASQELVMHPERICQVAGELISSGLVRLSAPLPASDEYSPVSRELAASALDQQPYITPGFAAVTSSPWGGGIPNPSVQPGSSSFSQGLPFEAESQWGNGGNGATFVPGRGWIASPQPSSAMRLGI